MNWPPVTRPSPVRLDRPDFDRTAVTSGLDARRDVDGGVDVVGLERDVSRDGTAGVEVGAVVGRRPPLSTLTVFALSGSPSGRPGVRPGVLFSAA
jgi:hypothetical protein